MIEPSPVPTITLHRSWHRCCIAGHHRDRRSIALLDQELPTKHRNSREKIQESGAEVRKQRQASRHREAPRAPRWMHRRPALADAERSQKSWATRWTLGPGAKPATPGGQAGLGLSAAPVRPVHPHPLITAATHHTKLAEIPDVGRGGSQQHTSLRHKTAISKPMTVPRCSRESTPRLTGSPPRGRGICILSSVTPPPDLSGRAWIEHLRSTLGSGPPYLTIRPAHAKIMVNR